MNLGLPKKSGVRHILAATYSVFMTEEQTYRPQDDFYRYTNGEWLATHEIPADRPMHGTFHELLD